MRARMLVLSHPASASLAQSPARWAQDAAWRGAAKDALAVRPPCRPAFAQLSPVLCAHSIYLQL